MTVITAGELFDMTATVAAPLLEKHRFPWEALPELKEFILALGPALDPEIYASPRPGVWIAKSARIAPTAFVGDCVIICPDAEIRHCAFIRGSAVVGAGTVVGNSCELKNAVLSDGAQVPHFNYVGDSILGRRAHMGAGAITSNVKSDRTPVCVRDGDDRLETGLKKFGALLGDRVEVGCNSVLNPGTVIGRDSIIYPLSCVRGVIPARSVLKTGGVLCERR